MGKFIFVSAAIWNVVGFISSFALGLTLLSFFIGFFNAISGTEGSKGDVIPFVINLFKNHPVIFIGFVAFTLTFLFVKAQKDSKKN